MAAIVVVPLCIDVDPNVAFKLVSVSGLLAMPWATYFLGTSLRLRFPGPMLMAMASLVFVWDSHFTIYGGNVASTMAGEFSFSIALALTLVYLGFVARGLATGRHRAIAATLLGLVALCHVIPLFFAVGATAMLLLLRPGWRQVKWLAVVMPTGGLLSAFWIVPFYLRSDYLNDMGWEKVGPAANGAASTYWQYLLPNTMPYHELIFGLAAIGAIISIVRANRAGLTFTLWALFGMVAFILMPQGRFWNARVLPFYILSLDLLAAVALTLLIGALVPFLIQRERWRPAATGVLAGVSVITVFLAVGLPIGLIPTAKSTLVSAPTVVEDQTSVPQLNGNQFGPFLSTQTNKATGWASWNFGGLEVKDRYPEFDQLMTTMGRLGEERGCGRAMWEHHKRSRITAPGWRPCCCCGFTDGCIGSMEGLYFEASMTTPFHFLNQSLLSEAPSRPQRDLPYQDLDVAEGVKRLQLYGVRYYMSRSEEATLQGKLTEGLDASLEEVAEVPRWTVTLDRTWPNPG
ncbi:MAG: 6-pyruvoyl-tetrahydropterin synthase-related protein [Microthrixaceae bacterium]